MLTLSLSPPLLLAGQIYNLGPGETLDNFSVHFKNGRHMANVQARLSGAGEGGPPGGAA